MCCAILSWTAILYKSAARPPIFPGIPRILLEQVGGREQAVMVGDTSYDVLGAKAHGIPTVGVSWGHGAVADMEKAGAIAIAHSMEELLALLRRKL